MSGRKNHGNNSKRFDVNSFYAYLKKAHVEELLDADGNTPYDSDTIDKSVWEYAAYLYKDIQDYGGRLSYFDSETFRADSDGSGTNNWTVITRTQDIANVYKPLRRWLYSLDSEEGIDANSDQITAGFNRKYYSLPVSDSEGTLRHVNIYTFLKSHFNRWLSFDPFERRKFASRVADNLTEDSDIRYRYADQVIKAIEEDSDLARRVVEQVSNVLQTDSEVRNEIVKSTILAFENDSDAARDLAKIIGNVLETDSDVRNEYTDSILTSIKQDSDQQVELGLILSSHEFTELSTQTIYTRRMLPMDSDDTGSIGDSDNRFALGNFTTLRTDDLKVRGLAKDRVVYVSDSEGKLETSSKLQWQGDSELLVDGHLKVTTDATLQSARISVLNNEKITYVGESDGRLYSTTRVSIDSEGRLIYDGIKILPVDSDKFVSMLVENIDSEFDIYLKVDSDAVEKILETTDILSENAVPPGPRGNIYFIDSDNTNTLVNDAMVKIGTDRENYYITSSEVLAALQKRSNHIVGDIVWDLDAQAPNIGGSAYVFDSDGAGNTSWTIDSDMSVNSGINEGRIVHNPDTKKTFFNDGTNVHTIGTARSFSDVIILENLAYSPDSDILGKEGLRPGTVAVADGTNWDPKSIGGATPYPVFWDGGQWLKFDLS